MRRAVGVVRVSQTAGREGERFASPSEQADRIRAECARRDLALAETFEELDVSGGAPLERRPGLSRAVAAVEAGGADVIVVAYFDRLVRSLRVQDEVVSRVERAGGQVLAVDVGEVGSGSAGQWLSGTLLGAVAEYQRRTTAERSGAAQARAVARGVPPFARIPPGYRRTGDGRLEPDERAPVVREAFELRAGGATVDEVRRHLRAHGIERSYHGTVSLLRSRMVLGELRFGSLSNLEAHEPIVDRDVWLRVQAIPEQRGARPASGRLLARLGVLRCGTCGARMVVGSSHHGRYPVYRCPPNGDCPRRVTVSAEMVERVVVDKVRASLADVEGRASLEQSARDAEAGLERAQRDLDAAIRAFAPVADEPAATERIAELAAARDAAREDAERLRGTGRLVIAVGNWELFTHEERRALIRAEVDAVTVAPGRGPGRVTVALRQ